LCIEVYGDKNPIVGVYTGFIDEAATTHSKPAATPCDLSYVYPISELLMKKNLLASLLIAATASIAVPAFASGYGPAPSYRPMVGAPASQQGQSAQTIAAESRNADANAYGGSKSLTQSGSSSRDGSTKSQAVFFGQ
jgi:hypothetical protein